MPIEKVPILELSGHSAGPSEPKLAWASVQAVWPSAASGLIVKPAGRVTVADLISEGEAAKLRNWGALELDVQSRGRVGLVGGRAGVEDRFEDLLFAAFDRRVAGFCASERCSGSW